jgi:hypothetical protein
MGVEGQCHAPAALPPGKTPYPLNRRLSGPPGWSRRVWKISPPTGFNSWIVQLLASRYPNPRHHNIKPKYIFMVPQWKHVRMKAGIFKYCVLWRLIPYWLPSTQERWTISKLYKVCQLDNEKNINFLVPFGNINPLDQHLYYWSHH